MERFLHAAFTRRCQDLDRLSSTLPGYHPGLSFGRLPHMGFSPIMDFHLGSPPLPIVNIANLEGTTGYVSNQKYGQKWPLSSQLKKA